MKTLDLGHVVEASGVSKEWRTDQLVRAFTQLKNEIQAVEFFEEGRALIVFSTSMFGESLPFFFFLDLQFIRLDISAREALKHAMELPFKLKPLSEVDRGTLETLDLCRLFYGLLEGS